MTPTPGGIWTFFQKSRPFVPLSTFDFTVTEVIIIVPTVFESVLFLLLFWFVFKHYTLFYWTVLKEYIQCNLEPQFGIMLCLLCSFLVWCTYLASTKEQWVVEFGWNLMAHGDAR